MEYVQMDCIPSEAFTAADSIIPEYINLIIVCVVGLAALYISSTFVKWSRRVWYTKNPFRWLFIAISFAKLGVFLWMASGVFQIVWFDVNLSIVSFPARFILMLAYIFMAWITFYFYSRSGPGSVVPVTPAT